MEYQEPTYEEYKKATKFARFRFRYGFIVLTLCWLCLIFIAYYMYSNGEALVRHPLIYGCDKLGVTCHCYNYDENLDFYVNGTTGWVDTKIVDVFNQYINETEIRELFSNITID